MLRRLVRRFSQEETGGGNSVGNGLESGILKPTELELDFEDEEVCEKKEQNNDRTTTIVVSLPRWAMDESTLVGFFFHGAEGGGAGGGGEFPRRLYYINSKV